jgi:16S rRNA (guanine527-N7)-methyltransferase
VDQHVSRETPPAPDVAAGVFAHQLLDIQAYADLLTHAGIERGLLGPREVPRLWERHLLNCGVLTDVIDHGATVADIGSGAGLPGVVMAIRRPDLTVTLVEPLLRRTTFLEEVVEQLHLANVEVVRSRAEELHGTRLFDVVTSRAVAPLERLLAWSMPLVRRRGHLLAMKGASAATELALAQPAVERLGGRQPEVLTLAANLLSFPTTVVRVQADGVPPLGLSRAESRRVTGSTRKPKKRR